MKLKKQQTEKERNFKKSRDSMEKDEVETTKKQKIHQRSVFAAKKTPQLILSLLKQSGRDVSKMGNHVTLKPPF